MANLLDTLKTYLSPELISAAARTLGENENGVSKALGALAPTILAGLLEKSSDHSAMASIFEAISRFDSQVLHRLDSLVGSGNLAHNDPKDASGQVLGAIFGPKVPVVTNGIAAFSGLKPSSVSSLLGLAGPMVLGFLSNKIATEGYTQSAFVQWLAAQKNQLLQLIPAPLSATLGWTGSTAGSGAATTTPAEGSNWLLPLLLLLGLGAGIVYYMKNCTQPHQAVVETPVAPIIDSAAVKAAALAEAAKTAASGYMKKLASGYEIKASTDGIESRLVAFIEDTQKLVDKTTWFNFDHLNFKTGSAELDMDYSKQQLTNIYEVLKAYPKVKIRIGGYTDSDGDDKSNLQLSQKRADNVMAALVAMGITRSRLSAEGYGEQHPECPANDTPQCKAQNRRIAVRVTEK